MKISIKFKIHVKNEDGKKITVVVVAVLSMTMFNKLRERGKTKRIEISSEENLNVGRNEAN